MKHKIYYYIYQWVKKFQRLVILKLKKINSTAMKVLVSNKISFDEKNYKYFIGYLHNDNKVKPLHIMLPKRSI